MQQKYLFLLLTLENELFLLPDGERQLLGANQLRGDQVIVVPFSTRVHLTLSAPKHV